MGIFDVFSGKKEPAVPAPAREYRNETTPRVITVWSSKGGVGKTTVAVNLAACLRAAGRRVVLVDIDEFGDAGYMAAHQEKYEKRFGGDIPSPEWLWTSINDVHSYEDLKSFLIYSEEGDYHLLVSGRELDPQKRLTAKAYDRITTLLLRYFDIVIFDCGPAYHQDTIRFALLRCDCLVAPFTQNKAMFGDFVPMVREFAKPASGIGKDKVVLVLNYYRPVAGVLSEQQARDAFRDVTGSPLQVLPNDGVAGARSVADGSLLVAATREKKLREGYRTLAQAVLDVLYAKKG